MKKMMIALLFWATGFLTFTAYAYTLPSGGSVSGVLSAGDTDSFTFTANAGESVMLTLSEMVSSYGQIWIYKPDSSYFTYGNNYLHLTLPVSGTYTAVVKFSNSSQSGTYTLRYVHGGDTVELSAPASGGSFSSHLSAYDLDSFNFYGESGEAVTLLLDEAASSYGQIYLYRPDGSYWTYANNLAHVTLPVTGSYTVILRLSNLTQSQDYTLHYQRGGDTVESGSLYSGQTTVDALSSYDMDSYTFSGMAGEAVTLIMDEPQSSYGQMYFYRPDGSYWTYANNLAHLTLPESGTYTLVVRYSNITQAGSYKLHYVLGGDQVENGLIESGNTYPGTLDVYDMDSYQFEGEAGDAITLIMDESASSYGQLYLYRPDGSYWTYGNNLLHVTLPETGTYTLIARFSTITQTGDYDIHYVRGGEQVEQGSLTSGQTTAATLSEYDMNSYHFTASAGQAITLALDESVASYGQLYFYKPDGSYWTYANNLAHLTLPETGEYTVVIRFSNLTDDGAYMLSYLCAGQAVENGGIVSGASMGGTLGSYDFDSYSFVGSAGFVANLEMTESESSYGQIFLYRPGGNYWTYGNNTVAVTLPETGTYTVVVRYSNIAQSGPYGLSYSLTSSN